MAKTTLAHLSSPIALMSDDLLADTILSFASRGDALALALTCRAFRVATEPLFDRDALGKKRTAISSATCSLRRLEWSVVECGLPLSARLFAAAAIRDDVAMLEWLLARGCPTSALACTNAAMLPNNINVLSWLHINDVPWTDAAWTAAAGCGNITALEYLRDNECDTNNNACSYAIENGHLLTVMWFVESYLDIEEDHVCTVAVKHNQIPILAYLYENGFAPNEETTSAAAGRGNLDALIWLNTVVGCALSTHAYNLAAQNGHLDIMDWLYSAQCPPPRMWTIATAASHNQFDSVVWLHEHNCPKSVHTCIAAARAGNLKILEWVRARDYAWDEQVYIGAARGGNLHIMEWALANGCGEIPTNAIVVAAEYGHTHIIDWLVMECGLRLPATSVSLAFHRAVHNGHLDATRCLHEHGYGLHSCPLIFTSAVCSENLETMDWLYSIRQEPIESQHFEFELLRTAKWLSERGLLGHNIPRAAYGDLDLMAFVVEHGAIPDLNTCAHVAAGGHLDVLRWLREPVVRCDWDEDVCLSAVEFGQVSILAYAVNNGCPFNPGDAAVLAAANGHTKILAWMLNNGYDMGTDICAEAALHGQLNTIRFLRSRQIPWDADSCSHAILGGHDHVLQWLIENGCPLADEDDVFLAGL